MDHHHLWLVTKNPKIVSEDVQINGDNCIDDKKEYHQEKAQVNNLEPLPAWMTLADETCMNELISSKDYSQKTSANQGILISQLATEELCLEDVQQLQKQNRELQAENIKKTLSYMMLEQDYYTLKDEIAVLRKDLKHWQESSGLMKLALREIYSNRNGTVRYGIEEMPELHGVKLEESIELNFPDEISSPPNSSSQCSIAELVDLRHQHVNLRPQSFSEFPFVAVSAEMSEGKSLSPVKSVNAMKQLNEIIPSPLNDVSHCPTGILIDLSEDTNQSQVSSVVSPFSDEMPRGIKFLSTLKKCDAANSEDELVPCTRKYFPYCSTEAVKPPRRSAEVVHVPKETSPHKKLSSPFNRINPEDAKINFKDPPKYYFQKKKELKCDVCDLYLNSQEQKFQHFKGSRHKLNCEEQLKNNSLYGVNTYT